VPLRGAPHRDGHVGIEAGGDAHRARLGEDIYYSDLMSNRIRVLTRVPY